MDAKLLKTVLRLVDVLEAIENHMKDNGEMSLEGVLCASQARLAIDDLEWAYKIKLKQFLRTEVNKLVANRDDMN